MALAAGFDSGRVLVAEYWCQTIAAGHPGGVTGATHAQDVPLFVLPFPCNEASENAACSTVGATSVWIAQGRF